jgi:hypothetical protein
MSTVPAVPARAVILHYHLFKNGGTSVDQILNRNFPGHFTTREFDGPLAERGAALRQWLIDEPEAVAFSSHTASLPLPRIDGLQVLPILFLRHPIDRIASAYAFEARQFGNTGYAAKLAQSTDFAGYVTQRLDRQNDFQCRDFQLRRLAAMYGPASGSDMQRALRALHSLPFVGLVEAFDASLARLEAWLKPEFPHFKSVSVQANVSHSRPATMAERLDKVRSDLGEAVYQRLIEANQADLALYAVATRLLELLERFPATSRRQ